MTPRRSLPLFALLIFLSSPAVFAQGQGATHTTAAPPAQAPTVAVAAAGARLRFTALGPVSRMRLEVFDAAGNPVSGAGLLPGSVRDWEARDPQGQMLPDGQYLCVVTVRDLLGRVSVKQGSVLLQNGEASLLELSGAEQAAGLASGGAEESLAKVGGAEAQAVTLTAHDGRDGQLTSTTGALTLRTGDVFAGHDKEQMRVTPA